MNKRIANTMTQPACTQASYTISTTCHAQLEGNNKQMKIETNCKVIGNTTHAYTAKDTYKVNIQELKSSS